MRHGVQRTVPVRRAVVPVARAALERRDATCATEPAPASVMPRLGAAFGAACVAASLMLLGSPGPAAADLNRYEYEVRVWRARAPPATAFSCTGSGPVHRQGTSQLVVHPSCARPAGGG